MREEEPAGRAGTEPRQRTRRFRIEIFEAWCKACGICVAFCPQECLSTNEEGVPLITAADRCTGCGWCEIHCPDFAIAVREETAKKGELERDDHPD